MVKKESLEDVIQKANLNPQQLNALVQQIKHPKIGLNRNPLDFTGDLQMRVGIVGDAHYNSKSCDERAIDYWYKEFKKAGVDLVVQTGDLTDGEYHHRQGHVYEIWHHGFDAVRDYVAERYPKINGIKTVLIMGNHDETYRLLAGADIVKAIAEIRSDMHYAGEDSEFQREADIIIGKKTILRLSHPGGGSAYAISYQPQKQIESMSGGEKPHIFIRGHDHKFAYLFYRNIHAFQAGTAMNQNEWARSLGLSYHKAAWILDIEMKRSGEVSSLTQRALPVYD